MEEITIENEVRQEQEELIINQEIKNHLLVYCKWGKFFGILAYIGAAFMFILSIIYLFIDTLTSALEMFWGSYINIISFIFFLACSILYFIGGRLILQSSNSTKIGIIQNNQLEVEKGIKKLASLMNFMGIATIVGICLYIIFIIIMVIIGVNTAMQTF
ncbi:MAG: hypothetical protein SO179_00480 [Bacteroidales bacterium]|nr:hypothetical protein [Bacteroidales bacterium]